MDRRVDLLQRHAPYHKSDHVINIAYKLHGLQAAINETSLRVWKQQPDEFFEHAYIDADRSIVEARDSRQGADVSYKKTLAYHPLTVSLANTGDVLAIENRSGARPSSEGAAVRFDHAIDLVQRAGFRSVTLRRDTDFSQTKHLDRWNEAGVRFVFGYSCHQNLAVRVDSLPKSAWTLLERGAIYITNRRDVSAREIVRLANARCAQECIIGQLKSGVGCLRALWTTCTATWLTWSARRSHGP